MKKTIIIDFDGVIHRYSKGWQDGSIYDPPFDCAVELQGFINAGFEVVIWSSRCCDRTHEGKAQKCQADEVETYLKKHNIPYSRVHRAPGKPIGFLYIDDRALRFEGDWEKTYADALAILNTASDD